MVTAHAQTMLPLSALGEHGKYYHRHIRTVVLEKLLPLYYRTIVASLICLLLHVRHDSEDRQMRLG